MKSAEEKDKWLEAMKDYSHEEIPEDKLSNNLQNAKEFEQNHQGKVNSFFKWCLIIAVVGLFSPWLVVLVLIFIPIYYFLFAGSE